MRCSIFFPLVLPLFLQRTDGSANFEVKGVSPQADLESLIHVHVVWRHGDRTPSILIPTDKANGIKTWPDGLGELTVKGLQQQYALGSLIRARYDGFLSKRYSPFEIYVRSSDFNRTLTSAQANLAAMYKPEPSEQFIKGMQWRPIPVHTLPKHEDKELYDKTPCPHADEEEQIVYNSPQIRSIEEDNRELLTFLATASGYYSDGSPLRLREVWKLFDPLWAEFNHPESHQLPEWVNETTRESIFKLYHLASSHLYGSPLLKRLRAGPLFGEILNRIESYALGRVDRREKLYAYSAHDTAVSALLAGFDIVPPMFPEYATACFVELHNSTSGPVVRVFYKNDTHKDDIFELNLPHCSDPCTVEQLGRVSADVLPYGVYQNLCQRVKREYNWAEECGLYQVVFPHFYLYLLFAATALTALTIATVVRVYRYRVVCVPNRIRTPNYKLLVENGDPEF